MTFGTAQKVALATTGLRTNKERGMEKFIPLFFFVSGAEIFNF
jgi:hypothetical protein